MKSKKEKAQELLKKQLELDPEDFIDKVYELVGDENLVNKSYKIEERQEEARKHLIKITKPEKVEAKKTIDTEPPPTAKEGKKFVVEMSSSGDESPEALKAKKKVAPLIKSIEDAGFVEMDPETIHDLKLKGFVPKEFSNDKVNAATQTALAIFSKGGSSLKFSKAVDESGFLNSEEKQQLQLSAFFLASLEETYQKDALAIQKAFNNPDVSIHQVTPDTRSPQPNQVLFQTKDNLVSPMLKGVFRTGFEEVKFTATKKVKNYITKAIRKYGSSVFKAVKKGAEKVVKEGIKKGIQLAVKAGIMSAEVGAEIAASATGVGLILVAAWEILKKAWKKFKQAATSFLRLLTGEREFKKQVMYLSGALSIAFMAVGQLVPAAISGFVSLSSGATMVSGASIGQGISGIWQTMVYGVTHVVAPAVSGAAISGVIILPIIIVVVLFIINSGAYIVPKGGFGSRMSGPGPWPPGGAVNNCDPELSGPEITSQLAARIRKGRVNLLPPSNGAMAQGLCITPTMIILHSSAGYDRHDGNNSTYNTLVVDNNACQMATDTDDTWLMQRFYEKQVQLAWCANSWNSLSINIELAGECKDGSRGPCARNWSACLVGTDSYPYTFTAPPPRPHHPCDDETELAVNALCEVMKQYNIPVSQIRTHDDVPNQDHGDPRGKDYVQYLINRIRNKCG
jgi:hypothetical protein